MKGHTRPEIAQTGLLHSSLRTAARREATARRSVTRSAGRSMERERDREIASYALPEDVLAVHTSTLNTQRTCTDCFDWLQVETAAFRSSLTHPGDMISGTENCSTVTTTWRGRLLDGGGWGSIPRMARGGQERVSSWEHKTVNVVKSARLFRGLGAVPRHPPPAPAQKIREAHIRHAAR